MTAARLLVAMLVCLSCLAVGGVCFAAEAYVYDARFGVQGFEPGQMNRPRGISFAPDGNLLLADTWNARIQKLTPAGAPLSECGSYGSDPGQLLNPADVAANPDGSLIVADEGNHRVQKFTSAGAFVAAWGAKGTGDLQFDQPCGVAVGPGGVIYVVDCYNHRIQKLSAAGALLAWWGRDTAGGSGAHAPGSGKLPTAGGAAGEFSFPGDVAVDASGNVYVADQGNNRVQKLDASGNHLASWGSLGPADGQFNDPAAIALDPAGNVYVADRDNFRVQKFTSAGGFLAAWGTKGTGDGQFTEPLGVAAASAQRVLVSDASAHRIQAFRQVTQAPAVPTGLKALPRFASEALLDWSDPDNIEAGFHLQRRALEGPTAADGWVQFALGANTTAYHDRGLVPDTRYEFRVRGHNAVGESPWSPAVALRTPAGPVPSIKFTRMPTFGTTEDLQGVAEHVSPEVYGVAVYIDMSGWWIKPYVAQPLTLIQPDGTWTCDVTTGGTDQNATRFAAFLWPLGTNPPTLQGNAALPEALFTGSVDSAQADRPDPDTRILRWAGYDWTVKRGYWGPGPNHFGGSEQNVWVDAQGRLHLKITYDPAADRWYCAEVVCTRSFGRGTYRFDLDSEVHDLHPDVVLGMFTWSDYNDDWHREIDVEITRWGQASDTTNAQYVVQPHWYQDHLTRFTIPPNAPRTRHEFTWLADRILFQSHKLADGIVPTQDQEIASWVFPFAQSVPRPGDETPRLNLWLYRTPQVADRAAVEREVIIRDFSFTILEGDNYETDDTLGQAGEIPTNGTRQSRTFHVGGDVDWVRFQARSGTEYALRTLVGTAQTVLELCDTDGTTLLAQAGGAGGDGAASIDWTCPRTGTYYLRVSEADPLQGTGTYELSARERVISGDVDGDGAFNSADLAYFIRAWRAAHSPHPQVIDPACDLAQTGTSAAYILTPDQQITIHDAIAFWELLVLGQ